MRKADMVRAAELAQQLELFERVEGPLPGVVEQRARESLIAQMIDSIRRVRYASVVQAREISGDRADPHSPYFDPILAAVLRKNEGNHDEACWLVFLATHTGKHLKTGWLLCRSLYGGAGTGVWSWERVSAVPDSFATWLAANRTALPPAKFGNHRRYETLKPTSKGTGAVVSSYVKWVGDGRSHSLRFARVSGLDASPQQAFDRLYRSMSSVQRFGRLGSFDFLAMLGKLGLAEVAPGSLYLRDATGPYRGACRIFGEEPTTGKRRAGVEARALRLAEALGVGPQELEDALCNWNKSPYRYRPFRG